MSLLEEPERVRWELASAHIFDGLLGLETECRTEGIRLGFYWEIVFCKWDLYLPFLFPSELSYSECLALATCLERFPVLSCSCLERRAMKVKSTVPELGSLSPPHN